MEQPQQTSEFAIVIHGGAGTIMKESMTQSWENTACEASGSD
jgi:hypothetical protein